MTALAPLMAIAAMLLLTACHRETKVPIADPRDVKLAQQANEIKRLQAERDAAQQASMELDQTVRDVEQQLNAILALDGRIRGLNNNIETDINVESSRDHVRKMLDALHDALNERKELASKATASLNAVDIKISTATETIRKQYAGRIAMLQTTLQKLEEDRERLIAERDNLERLYNAAKQEVVEVRQAADETQKALDAEHIQRELAESEANRVLVAVFPKAELKTRKLLAGPFWNRRADCSCTACFVVADRRTVAPFHLAARPENVRVYSKQPKDSYSISADGVNASVVEIKKSDEFWGASPCVVIGY